MREQSSPGICMLHIAEIWICWVTHAHRDVSYSSSPTASTLTGVPLAVLGVLQYFLRECYESKVIDICWIKGLENNADVFTKKLHGPAFEKIIKTLVGQDVYVKFAYLWARKGVRRYPSTQKSIQNFNWRRACRMQTYYCPIRTLARHNPLKGEWCRWDNVTLCCLSGWWELQCNMLRYQQGIKDGSIVIITELSRVTQGIPIAHIDRHLLRSGGANALAFLYGYSNTQIEKMGRWKEATFKE